LCLADDLGDQKLFGLPSTMEFPHVPDFIPLSFGTMVPTRNAIGIEFLRTEVETALVFARIASNNHNKEKKRRNVRNARRAYQTLLYFLSQFVFTDQQQHAMREKLTELHRQLVVLGESL